MHLFIKVRKQDGQELLGDVDVTKEETLWNFIPTEDWQTGVYTLEIDGRLEDLAGNNLYECFDKPSSQKRNFTERKKFSYLFEV